MFELIDFVYFCDYLIYLCRTPRGTWYNYLCKSPICFIQNYLCIHFENEDQDKVSLGGEIIREAYRNQCKLVDYINNIIKQNCPKFCNIAQLPSYPTITKHLHTPRIDICLISDYLNWWINELASNRITNQNVQITAAVRQANTYTCRKNWCDIDLQFWARRMYENWWLRIQWSPVIPIPSLSTQLQVETSKPTHSLLESFQNWITERIYIPIVYQNRGTIVVLMGSAVVMIYLTSVWSKKRQNQRTSGDLSSRDTDIQKLNIVVAKQEQQIIALTKIVESLQNQTEHYSCKEPFITVIKSIKQIQEEQKAIREAVVTRRAHLDEEILTQIDEKSKHNKINGHENHWQGSRAIEESSNKILEEKLGVAKDTCSLADTDKRAIFNPQENYYHKPNTSSSQHQSLILCENINDDTLNVDHYLADSLLQIDSVFQSTQQLENCVMAFSDTKHCKEYKNLQETFIRYMIKLDRVENRNCEIIKQRKSETLELIQKLIKVLESKTKN